MLTQRKRTHGSWGIEQLFKCPCTIVRWPLKHCSLEHEECFHHQMWQMAWNFHHFIPPNIRLYPLSLTIRLEEMTMGHEKGHPQRECPQYYLMN